MKFQSCPFLTNLIHYFNYHYNIVLLISMIRQRTLKYTVCCILRRATMMVKTFLVQQWDRVGKLCLPARVDCGIKFQMKAAWMNETEVMCISMRRPLVYRGVFFLLFSACEVEAITPILMYIQPTHASVVSSSSGSAAVYGLAMHGTYMSCHSHHMIPSINTCWW